MVAEVKETTKVHRSRHAGRGVKGRRERGWKTLVVKDIQRMNHSENKEVVFVVMWTGTLKKKIRNKKKEGSFSICRHGRQCEHHDRDRAKHTLIVGRLINNIQDKLHRLRDPSHTTTSTW